MQNQSFIKNEPNFTNIDLEPKILQYLSELQSLRNCSYRSEAVNAAARADAESHARQAAERAAREARAEANSATLAAQHASSMLAKAMDEAATCRMQADLAEREKASLSAHLMSLVTKLNEVERERDELVTAVSTHTLQQQTFKELQQRANKAAEQAESATRRLESELRRVSAAATSGADIRERARMSAAHRARERATLNEQLKRVQKSLNETMAENTRLRADLNEAQYRRSGDKDDATLARTLAAADEWKNKAQELRSAVECERAGAARLSAALAAATEATARLAAATAVANASNITSDSNAMVNTETVDINKMQDNFDDFFSE